MVRCFRDSGSSEGDLIFVRTIEIADPSIKAPELKYNMIFAAPAHSHRINSITP